MPNTDRQCPICGLGANEAGVVWCGCSPESAIFSSRCESSDPRITSIEGELRYLLHHTSRRAEEIFYEIQKEAGFQVNEESLAKVRKLEALVRGFYEDMRSAMKDKRLKIAIDIDGTFTAWPDMLSQLFAKHDCVLLTGYSGAAKSMEELESERYGQIRSLYPSGDIPEIIICVGNSLEAIAIGKGEYCLENLIDICIDDSELYTQHIRRISPTTLVCRVLN